MQNSIVKSNAKWQSRNQARFTEWDMWVTVAYWASLSLICFGGSFKESLLLALINSCLFIVGRLLAHHEKKNAEQVEIHVTES